MPRPKTYDRGHVVEAAKEMFWQNGYDATAISALEENTGLNRSSLYLAFGDKRTLFLAALDRYEETFIAARLRGMESRGAGLADITAFLSGLRDLFLADPDEARRGCLMVNSIAELSGRDPDATIMGEDYLDRLRRAFTNALDGAAANGDVDGGLTARRASLMASATLGIWLTARMDPVDAAEVCATAVAEVESWRAPGEPRPVRPAG